MHATTDSNSSLLTAALAEIKDASRGRVWFVRIPLLVWFVYILVNHVRNPEYQSFFGGLNLGIHEFGHLITSPFGEFVGVLGGSVVQCLAPVISFVMFYSQRDYFAFGFAFVWLGTNLLSVARYIADARRLELHLVSPFGGNGEIIHDWNYILNKANLLQYEQTIANVGRAAGFLCMGIGIAWGAWIIWTMIRQGAPTAPPEPGRPS